MPAPVVPAVPTVPEHQFLELQKQLKLYQGKLAALTSILEEETARNSKFLEDFDRLKTEKAELDEKL